MILGKWFFKFLGMQLIGTLCICSGFLEVSTVDINLREPIPVLNALAGGDSFLEHYSRLIILLSDNQDINLILNFFHLPRTILIVPEHTCLLFFELMRFLLEQIKYRAILQMNLTSVLIVCRWLHNSSHLEYIERIQQHFFLSNKRFLRNLVFVHVHKPMVEICVFP
jgi:hypothetical protein